MDQGRRPKNRARIKKSVSAKRHTSVSKRKFNEGGRVQDWLSLFFAFVDSLYMPLVRDDDMAVSLGYWVPFTSWYSSSCPAGAPLARLEARRVEDSDLSLAQTTFHVRHLFVSTGHMQTSFISSRSWRLTRAFLHALLRCADHVNSTRFRLTSNVLSIRTTERHITVGWCKEVSRDVLFSTISSQRFPQLPPRPRHRHSEQYRDEDVTDLQQAFVVHGFDGLYDSILDSMTGPARQPL